MNNITQTAATSHEVQVTIDTAWDNTVQSFTNQSVVVNNTAMLSINNSTVTFNDFSNTGFNVDNGSLYIYNSTIMAGGKCITGYNTGNVTIIDSTIIGCNSDAIELEGDYRLNIQNSQFTNINNRGIDLLNLPHQVIINNTVFYNTTDDAIRHINTDMFILNSVFELVGDDAIDGRGNSVLDMRDSLIKNTIGDGLNLDDNGYYYLEGLQIVNVDDGIQYDGDNILEVRDTIISNTFGDGIVVGGPTDLYFSNISITNTGDEGIQVDFAKDVEIRDTSITSPSADGIDLFGVTNYISILDTQVDNSGSSDGLQITNSNATILITGLESLNNEQNGIEFTNVTAAQVSNSVASANVQSGLEIWNSGEITVVDSQFNNNAIGIWMNDSNSLDVTGSKINNNEVGLLFGYSNTVDIKNSDLVGNTVAVNASMMPTGAVVDVTNNYWGTTNYDEIIIDGEVLIEPILDSNGMTVSRPTDTPTESTTPDDGNSGNSGLSIMPAFMVLLSLGMFTLLKRKRNL